MIRKLLILTQFAIFFCKSEAQKQADNWLFGSRCWVNFSTGQPVANDLNPWITGSGSISMSNQNGSLVYYGSAFSVYNRLHQEMPLSPLLGFGGLGSGRVTISVPYPGHDSLYLVFYPQYYWGNNYVPRLMYAIINMNQQNGYGNIPVKDVLLLNGDSICLKMTAALHCNKKDIWLIGHYKNSNKYYSLLVTSAGISSTPVISQGAMINDSYIDNNRGQMKVSPLGDKIASGFMGDLDMIEIADFNSQTGQLSNFKIVTTRPSWTFNQAGYSGFGPYGVEFSPSGKYLYASTTYNIALPSQTTAAHLLFQFDATLSTATAIQSSMYKVDSVLLQQASFKGMQLANDGKIYVSNVFGNLHVINNPEGQGASCNFVRHQVNLAVGTTAGYPGFDLPFFLQSYFRYPIIATGNCQFQNISFSVQNPVGVSTIQWDFGDPSSGANNTSNSFNPTHIYTSQGVYIAKAILVNSNGCGADTITKIIHSGPFKVFLGNDTTICQGDTLKLKMKVPNASNLWNNNSTDTVLKITQSGTYWVRVNIGECITKDSINVFVRSLPTFSLGSDTTICNNQPLTLAPASAPLGATYVWSNGSTSPNFNVTTPGAYWLSLADNYGCTYNDTIDVQYKSLPNFSLGADTILCQANLVLNAAVNGASNYLWNNGSTSSNTTASQTGTYWADVTKENCTYRDSINVMFKPYPIVNFGNDTTLCEGATMMLSAQNQGATYLWQDNSTGPYFTVTQPGAFNVSVSLNGCIKKDTLKVGYDLKPKFTLGSDLLICGGQELLLKPMIQTGQYLNYLWQDGSTDQFYTAAATGLYTLELTNICGSQKDSVIISKGACQLYIPTAFSPNRDGLNDVFKARFGENITKFKLQVFNRWGQKVFESSDIKDGWDGSLNGKRQAQGIYVWLITYEVSNRKAQHLKGTVLLVD
jgi:gliding motility-associated-like protein